MDQVSNLGISSPLSDQPFHAPGGDEIRAAIEQVLGSHSFRSADSQRAFLRFVSDEVMAGRGGEVKEYSIAIEALGRGSEFDPRLDPIVRTQARKLRARLTAYYETEGRGDAIRIELRKGSYAPRFYYAEAAVSSPPQVPVAAIVPAGQPTAGRHRRRAIMAGAAVVVLCAGAAFYLGQNHMQEPGSLTVISFVNTSGVNASGASGDPGAQVLEDRLSASLISSLRQRGLKIVSQGARAMLTGKFLKTGTKIRGKVQLSGAAHSSRFWSGSYEGDISEIQIVVREITDDVSDMLGYP